jgi:hypothetical protein
MLRLVSNDLYCHSPLYPPVGWAVWDLLDEPVVEAKRCYEPKAASDEFLGRTPQRLR